MIFLWLELSFFEHWMCLMYLMAHTVCMISYDWHSPQKEVECVLQTAWKNDVYE